MSQPEFTPGPWRVKPKGEAGYPFGVLGAPHSDGGDYAPIAVFVKESDAQLFAAAPALYDVAREAARLHVCCCGPRDASPCLKCTADVALALVEVAQ